MTPRINVAIPEDHPSLMDGNLCRLSCMHEIEVLATGTPGGGARIQVEVNPVGVPVVDLEALPLCASYPDKVAIELSKRFGIYRSTLRNLLSGAHPHPGVGAAPW